MKRANGQCVKMLLITGIPFVAFLVAVVLLWHEAVGWPDLALLGGLYLVCGFGITVGFHRMAAHRAFAAVPVFKVTLLILGSMAVQGPVIKWVVDHRAHHAFSDRAGDPHSPHHDFPDTFAGRVRGLAHAHIGWMFEPQSAAERGRYARDLLADPAVRFIDRTFLVWGVLSFLLPLGAGYALSGGEPRGALTALLWGGPVRLFLNHHVSWSVNSICHAFGQRPFAASDRSTNNWLLAVPSLGESWHHNHHVFPASAVHGLERGQIDLSGGLINACARIGLVRGVRRVSPEQLARKRVTVAAPDAAAASRQP